MSQGTQTRHTFCFEVDGKTFQWEHPRISGGEIMDAAGIPREVGLIHVFPDGAQEVVPEDALLNLAELAGKFKRCPVFIRG